MIVVITPYRELRADDSGVRWSLLTETVASVDAQPVDFLHIIVDDGNDHLVSARLRATFSGPRRLIIGRTKPPDEVLGCSGPLNTGFDALIDRTLPGYDIADDWFVTVLHSDDLALNLDLRISGMSEGISFLYSDAALLLSSANRMLRWAALSGSAPKVRRWCWVLGRMPYPTMTWRLSFLTQLRHYTQQRYAHRGVMDHRVGCGEDVDLALCSLEVAILSGAMVRQLDAVTAIYRIHPSSLSEFRARDERAIEERFILKKHFGKSSVLLHAARLLIRPECTFPRLMALKVPFRDTLSIPQVQEGGRGEAAQ